MKGKKPFYCTITTNAPHTPLQVRPEDEKRYADKVKDADTAKFFGMIANIDDNVGKLLAKLRDLGIERDTLVVFMNDNGGTGGVRVFNAGMRGAKNTPWLGGTRASSLWRWPGTLKPADVDRLAAHVDFFPTIAALAGAKETAEIRAQVEGRSLVPLLVDPKAEWPDRIAVHAPRPLAEGAKIADYKYAGCAVRTTRWHIVSNDKGRKKAWQLFDVKADPGEKVDVAAKHADVVRDLERAYDRWWDSVQPQLVNEKAVGPKVNPFRELYEKQFGK